MRELLQKLAGVYGPSGNEEPIRDAIQKEIEDHVDEFYTDVMGNLIAVKKGKGGGKRVLLAAHMDQIGLMVTHIDDKGFLRFAALGGISVANSICRRVIFRNGITGVIGYETEVESWKDITLAKMYIDIGASGKEEAESQIKIGDVAVYHSPFSANNDKYMGGAMDDRAGCALLVETIKSLESTPNDLYFVFTTQEEVGLRGAKTSAYALEPDLGISVDVTITGDTPKAKPMAVSLGEGPAIKIKDASILAHPKVKELMVGTAKKHGIPYQLEILEFGGTDSGAIHLSRGGVPSGVLSIPCRYVHSDSETIDANDLKNGVKLLVKILEGEINF
ncbi:MAG: M42 family metallopeptidase [Clostridiales bacterium]|nr:M42 family metallopeptidase [Clostridiales bacterium]